MIKYYPITTKSDIMCWHRNDILNILYPPFIIYTINLIPSKYRFSIEYFVQKNEFTDL